MKYKVIKSFAHDFTDSFMSLMNYFDDDYVVDELRTYVADLPKRTLTIQWKPIRLDDTSGCSPRIQASRQHYQTWLPQLAAAMSLDYDRLTEITTVLCFRTGGLYATTTIVDDRGTTHTAKKP